MNKTHEERGVAMRVLVIEPERKPEEREIDSSLKTMQSIVGGLIQPIYLDDSVVLLCNDDGKFMDLPANRGCGIRMGRYTISYSVHSSCAAHPQIVTILPA